MSNQHVYLVEHGGEPAAAIRPYLDIVEIAVAYDAGGDPGEFEAHMLSAVEDWFDGASVKRVKPVYHVLVFNRYAGLYQYYSFTKNDAMLPIVQVLNHPHTSLAHALIFFNREVDAAVSEHTLTAASPNLPAWVLEQLPINAFLKYWKVSYIEE